MRAYRILRQRLGPDAEIAGPSLGEDDHAAVQAFLEYCLANGCEVNALTFHANHDSPGGLAAYPLHVQDARTSFLDNPRYAPLRIRRILNNEMGGPIYTRQPAGTLAHYDAFEAGGADAAARSCWNNGAGMSECFNGTLNGLLTHGTLQPRAVWWAHTLYAAGVDTRVASTVSGPNVVSVASRSTATSTGQILIGHVDFDKTLNNQTGTLNVELDMNNITALPEFTGTGGVMIRIESIPATNEAPLSAPIPIRTSTAILSGGSTRVTLPPIAVGEVLRVTLSPAHLLSVTKSGNLAPER